MDKNCEGAMIGLLNVKSDLKEVLRNSVEIQELDNYIDPHPVLSGLFVDWRPNTSGAAESPQFALQGIYVEHYAKAGTPIVIFDRHLALTNTEYSWLKKFNITFCEPVIQYRRGFQWMPIWVESTFKLKSFRRPEYTKRECLLYYNGDITDRLMSFDKYYKKTALILSKEVRYNSDEVTDLKVEEFKKLGINRLAMSYSAASSTILIGSAQDYIFGRLPDNLFDIMRSGCVPLLPIEHRFYAAGWDKLVISNEHDLRFLLSMSETYGDALIEDLILHLLERYPEFDINFTAERIKSLLL